MSDSVENGHPEHIEMAATEEKEQQILDMENCDTHVRDKQSSVTKQMFLCDECGKQFTTKHCLSGHLKAHSLKGHKSLVKCHKCDQLFLNQASLAMHNRVHLDPFRCEVCGKCFKKKSNLDGHKLVHEGRQPYTCDTCGEEFAYKSLLKYHLKDHSGEKLFECKVCGRKLKTKATLKMHTQLHSSDRNFKCVFCSKTFKHSHFLVSHIKTHTKLMPVTCSLCYASFSSKPSLRAHMRRHPEHIAENQWKCLKCGMIFASNASLISHLSSDSHLRRSLGSVQSDKTPGNKDTYICSICGKNFAFKRCLNKHMKYHEAMRTWKCEICDEIFLSRTLLSTHRVERHKGKRYKCQFCEKTFTIRKSLNIHYMFHISENTWKCVICDQVFSSLSLLNRHRRASHKVKSGKLFKCDFCDKGFTTEGLLTTHNKVHIAKNTWKCLSCYCLFPDIDTLKTHKKCCQKRCKFCDATFPSRQSFIYHKEIHIAKDCWKCLVCGEILPDQNSFSTHEHKCRRRKFHIGQNKWMCLVCRQIFPSLNLLHSHRRKKHKIGRYNLFKCGFCHKGFINEIQLKQHKKFHTGKNTWKCLSCSSQFLDHDMLKSHTETCPERCPKCNFCDLTFSDKQSLSNHRKIHIAKGCWKCLVCDEIFPNRKSYLFHEVKCKEADMLHLEKNWCEFCEMPVGNIDAFFIHKQIHIDKNSWKCLTCSKILSSERSLKYHQSKKCGKCQIKRSNDITDQMTTSLDCKTCGFKIAKSYMKRHSFLHRVQGKLIFLCLQCGKRFTTKRALKKHSVTHKCKKAFDLRCKKCGLVFTTRLGLVHHKKTHRDNLHYKCNIFRNKLMLRTNLNKEKKGEFLRCQECFAKFSCKISLTYHSRTHNYSYNCEVCSAKFNSSHSLIAHKDDMHKLTYQNKCTYCFKMFEHKFCYESHMAVHNKRYACKLCNARFMSKQKMINHMRFNKFKCLLCQKKFHLKKSLAAHKTVHVSESRWKCKDCNNIFPDKRSLIIHYNNKHGILGKRKRKRKKIYQPQCVGGCIIPSYEGKHNYHISQAENYSCQRNNKSHIKITKDSTKTVCCLVCGVHFNCRMSLQIHNGRWHAKYSCYHCKLEFNTDSKSYRSHMLTHEFSCAICYISFKKYSKLEEHLKVHELKKHKCPHCGKLFYKIGTYLWHILTHENRQEVCKYCYCTFEDQKQLECHISEKHASIFRIESSYYCKHCGESFIRLPDLQDHSKAHHNTNECIHFKTEFDSYEEWKDTIALFARNKSDVFCFLCSEVINLEMAADYCLLISSSQKPHKCKTCNKHFLQKKRLIEHFYTHGHCQGAKVNSKKPKGILDIETSLDVGPAEVSPTSRNEDLHPKEKSCKISAEISFSNLDKTSSEINNFQGTCILSSGRPLQNKVHIPVADAFASEACSSNEGSCHGNFNETYIRPNQVRFDMPENVETSASTSTRDPSVKSCFSTDGSSDDSNQTSVAYKKKSFISLPEKGNHPQDINNEPKSEEPESQTEAGVTEKPEKNPLSQKNVHTITQKTLRMIIVGRNSNSVNKLARRIYYSQSSVTNVTNASMNENANAHISQNDAYTHTENKFNPYDLMEKTEKSQHNSSSLCNTYQNEDTSPPVSESDICPENNPERSLSVLNAAVKSECEVEPHSDVNSSSPFFTQINNQSFESHEIKIENNAYQLEDIKPDLLSVADAVPENIDMNHGNQSSFNNPVEDRRFTKHTSIGRKINLLSDSDKATKSNDLSQEHVTPFNNSVKDGRFANQTCGIGMITPSPLSISDKVTGSNDVKQEPRNPSNKSVENGRFTHQTCNVRMIKQNPKQNPLSDSAKVTYINNMGHNNVTPIDNSIEHGIFTKQTCSKRTTTSLTDSDKVLEKIYVKQEDLIKFITSDKFTRNDDLKQEYITTLNNRVKDGTFANQTCNVEIITPSLTIDSDTVTENNYVIHDPVASNSTVKDGRFTQHKSNGKMNTPNLLLESDKVIQSVVKKEPVTPLYNEIEGNRYAQHKPSDGMIKVKGSGSKVVSCKLFKCDICRKPFPDRLSELVHRRTHSGMLCRLKCKTCNIKFRKMDELVRHQSKHWDKNAPQFYCCFCDESFSDEAFCKYHIKFRLCL